MKASAERNKNYCRESRLRKHQAELLLREEIEVLTLFETLVEQGPELFSCHGVEPEAPFSFVCESFYHRLQVAPDELLGKPLASIVDPRDGMILTTALSRVLANSKGAGGDDPAEPADGTLVNLRILVRGSTYGASMTMGLGEQGLIVVTRLYGN
eukprot:g5533.t1